MDYGKSKESEKDHFYLFILCCFFLTGVDQINQGKLGRWKNAPPDLPLRNSSAGWNSRPDMNNRIGSKHKGGLVSDIVTLLL